MARQTWSSRLTYILTVAGATIGFGATWRFPYLVGQNGGGAYVLMFILVMILVGIPIILVENVIGRRAQTNSVDAFYPHKESHSPSWKFFGYLGLLGSFGILSYYMPIGGWVISYVYHVFLGALGIAGGLDLSAPITKDVTEAFYVDQIEQSPWAITIFTGLFVLINWWILRKGIIAGIERSVKYLMPLLFICLIIMVVRNLTLDGAMEGVKFYLTPDFSKLSGKLFLDVLGQVFFALSLGFGVMITLSSHLKREENLVKTATITGIINTLIAVLAGFMIFPSLFSAGLTPDQGPSLVFKTLPIAFSHMAFGNFFAIVFFLLLVIAALTTSLTIYQVIISVLYEKFQIRYVGSINVTLLVIFVFGNIPCILSSGPLSDVSILGRSIFDTYDFFSGNICFVITALGATLYVGWVLKEQALAEVTNGNSLKGSVYTLWYKYVRFIIPAIIVAIFVYGLVPMFSTLFAPKAVAQTVETAAIEQVVESKDAPLLDTVKDPELNNIVNATEENETLIDEDSAKKVDGAIKEAIVDPLDKADAKSAQEKATDEQAALFNKTNDLVAKLIDENIVTKLGKEVHTASR